MRKGQSAMEYLMTYGWAILIVIVITAVLVYYGLFKPPVGKSISGFGSVIPLDSDYTTAGVLKLYVENRVGDNIRVMAVSADSGSGPVILTGTSGMNSTISMSGRKWINGTTGVAGSQGDGYVLKVAIIYARGSMNLTTSGTVTGARS